MYILPSGRFLIAASGQTFQQLPHFMHLSCFITGRNILQLPVWYFFVLPGSKTTAPRVNFCFSFFSFFMQNHFFIFFASSKSLAQAFLFSSATFGLDSNLCSIALSSASKETSPLNPAKLPSAAMFTNGFPIFVRVYNYQPVFFQSLRNIDCLYQRRIEH